MKPIIRSPFWQSIVLQAARIATLVAIFSLNFYPNIVKIALPIAVVLSILIQDFSRLAAILRKRWGILVGLALVVLFAVGISYTQAPLKDAIEGLFKYNKILYLPFLVPLFTAKIWRERALNILILATFLDIPITFLYFHGFPNITQHLYPGGYPVYAISVSAILAFVAFVLIQRIFNSPNNYLKFFYTLLFIFATYSLFFIYIERSGQLVFFGLLALFALQRWRGKGLLAATFVLPLLFIGLFTTSQSFNARIKTLINEPIIYLANPQKETSIGDRLAFAQYSWQIIKRHPIVGSGTGSFKKLYLATHGPQVVHGSPLNDPHDEYVMIMVQLGIIGLLLFLAWLAMTISDSLKLPTSEKCLTQGLVLTTFLTGFCNASVYIAMIGLFFVLFLGVFYGAPIANEQS